MSKEIEKEDEYYDPNDKEYEKIIVDLKKAKILFLNKNSNNKYGMIIRYKILILLNQQNFLYMAQIAKAKNYDNSKTVVIIHIGDKANYIIFFSSSYIYSTYIYIFASRLQKICKCYIYLCNIFIII